MNRWISGTRAGIIALVITIAVILNGTSAATAATGGDTPSSIAADIHAAFGPDFSAPLDPSSLLLRPDTGSVAPVTQGGLTIWPNTQPGVSHAARSLGSGVTQQFVRIASYTAPTAKDATGTKVPAHYEYANGGNTLIKVADHHQATFSYPVVLDPIQIGFVIFGAWVLFKCVVNGTKEAKALKGQKWYKTMWGVSWACVTGVI